MLGEIWLKVNRPRFGSVEKKVREAEEGFGVTATPGKSFKNALTLEKDNFPILNGVAPTLEIVPSKEMLDYLQWTFMGELFHQKDALEVQQALVMEGIRGVKVIEMGDRKMLLHIEGMKDIDPVRNSHLAW